MIEIMVGYKKNIRMECERKRECRACVRLGMELSAGATDS